MTEAQRTLSERETEVLRMLATGATNQQIAEELVISINTVKVHARNIYDKLGVQTRTEATLAAIRLGLISMPQAALDEATKTTAQPAADLMDTTNGTPQPTAADAPLETTPTQPLTTPTTQPNRRLVLWLAPLLTLLIALAGVLVWQTVQATTAPTPTPAASVSEGQIITSVVSVQKWRDIQAMPSPRGGLALVAQGEGVYAIGGQTADGVSDKVERYTFNDTWTTAAHKPTAVRDIQAVVVSGQVYVPGGCDAQGQPTDVVEVYSPAKDEWTTAAHLPRPLCGYALAAVEGKIYLIGGWDGSAYHAETLTLTPGSAEWQAGPPMPTARAYAAAAVVDGNIHVIGGENGAPLTTHEVLNPTGDTNGTAWKAKASLVEARSHLGVVAVGRRVYALGGASAAAGLAIYDVSADEWRIEQTGYTETWRGLGLTAYDTRLYAMGGDGPLNVSRTYQALYQLIIPIPRPGP